MSTEPPPSPPPDTLPDPAVAKERERLELERAAQEAHEASLAIWGNHQTPRKPWPVKPPEDDEKGKPP